MAAPIDLDREFQESGSGPKFIAPDWEAVDKLDPRSACWLGFMVYKLSTFLRWSYKTGKSFSFDAPQRLSCHFTTAIEGCGFDYSLLPIDTIEGLGENGPHVSITVVPKSPATAPEDSIAC